MRNKIFLISIVCSQGKIKKEEKKIRKEKIKVEKKMIREKKKELKELQKIEKIKTDNRLVGTYDIRQGTSVIKLS